MNQRIPTYVEKVLAAARSAGYGPDTKKADRWPLIRELQEAGCTRRQIADLLGVSRIPIEQQITEERRKERERDRATETDGKRDEV